MISLHLITREMELKYICLGVRKVEDRHTATVISDSMDAILERFDIQKLFNCTNDNATKMIKGVNMNQKILYNSGCF